MESEITVPVLRDRAAMAAFDFTMTYRRGSHVWTPYVTSQLVEELATPPVPKTAAYPVARIQSNPYDRSGRNRYSAELMKRVKVASYGRLAPTEDGPRSPSGPPGRAAKLALIASHKFTLAFENSIAPDYVTEKFFDPLVAGSVPVYLGAPNVADFAPAARSYIDVNDFPGPRDLGTYLDHLDRHDDEYEAYLEWKQEGPSQPFRALVASAPPRPFCRLAELVAQRLGASPAGVGLDVRPPR